MSNATDYTTRIIIEATELLSGKGNDYGGPEKSFTDIATITSIMRGKKITPLDVAAMLIALKLSRLGNLTRDDASEPVYDTVVDIVKDAINYMGLFEAVRMFEAEGSEGFEIKIKQEESGIQ